MAGEARKQFEVIKEGLARATFGGALSGCATTSVGTGVKLAAVDNNGGLSPEEFFTTNSRLLSMAVTPYRKFDFTQAGVLKAAVGLFEGLTLYANHRADVNDWKGLVQDCVWDDKNEPPGINAMLVIDKTVDPKLARGLEIKALRSVSVTIWFEYLRSHPDLANFYDRLGEVVEGEMVRFIVTKITQAGEVSIVWEGEDPYAKTFGAGGGDQGQQRLQGLQGPLTTREDGEMKLTVAVMTALGLTAGVEVTDAQLEEKIVGLVGQVTSLKANAAIGVATLTEARERAVTLYKAAKGEKSVETFISGVIEKADLVTARAFCLEYQGEVDQAIPLACPKCGEKLSRRSSRESEENLAPVSGQRLADYQSV